MADGKQNQQYDALINDMPEPSVVGSKSFFRCEVTERCTITPERKCEATICCKKRGYGKWMCDRCMIDIEWDARKKLRKAKESHKVHHKTVT